MIGGEGKGEKSNIRVNVVLNGYLGVREKFKLKNFPSFCSCIGGDHAVFAPDQSSVATVSPFVSTTRDASFTYSVFVMEYEMRTAERFLAFPP